MPLTTMRAEGLKSGVLKLMSSGVWGWELFSVGLGCVTNRAMTKNYI
jgi:hypothetical protein